MTITQLEFGKTLTQTQESHTEDIDKMKVTLYTPLQSTDTDPS